MILRKGGKSEVSHFNILFLQKFSQIQKYGAYDTENNLHIIKLSHLIF